MFRFLLILSLALPATVLARPGKGKGKSARNRAPAARAQTARAGRPARRQARRTQTRRTQTRRTQTRRTQTTRRTNRVNTRVVVKPTGRAMRAPTRRPPSRMRTPGRRHRGHYRSPAPRYRYGRRPRYRPVVIVIDHHLVYDRIARAERRMNRLELRTAQMRDWRDQRDLERDASDMRGEIAALDRDSDRIRSWYHWERSQARIHRLRRRLGVVQGDLAAGPRSHRQPEAHSTPARPTGVAISAARFDKIEFELESATFRDDKMRVVRRIAAAHWFTSAQARAVARLVHNSDDRVEALRLLHPRVVDPENFQAVYDTLPSRRDRETLDAAVYTRF